MISINLIRGEFPASEKALDQVLGKVAPSWYSPRPPQSLSSAGLPPSLHPRLMERLLGKSPLRLVVERHQVEQGIWREKLECGHEITTFQEFVWTEDNSLVRLEPTAKRRRCQKCKPIVAPVLKTTAEIRADQKRAELIHKQKLRFGSLFDAVCFPDGQLRPGPTEDELLRALRKSSGSRVESVTANLGPHDAGDGVSLPDSIPSPKKPVQSVRRDAKRRPA